jgi:hypothetical protein
MIRSQLLLINLKRPPQQWLGLSVLPLGLIQQGQIVQAPRGVEMIRSQLLFVNLKCPLIQWLGLGVLPLGVIESCQIV